MDKSQDLSRVKRFKHQSYEHGLRNVHLKTSHNQARFGNEIPDNDNDSHFHQSLEHWRQLNISPSFIAFSKKVDDLSASMPLLLHNWKEIIGCWVDALDSSDEEGLRPLLNVLQQIAYDLRTTLSPVYSELLTHLLKLLPRSLNPGTLTALLETFSSFFKHLLVPSVGTTLLEQTWADFRVVIRNCSPETQRAMAEVWASVLRRLKLSSRERAVNLLVENIQGIQDAVAWVFVFACKSVSQTLHSATTSIIAPLIEAHLLTHTSDEIYVLIRRVLTALLHHVKNAEQYHAVADLLILRFSRLVNSTDPSSPEDLQPLRLIMEVITVPCAVRNGSRLTQSHLDTIMGALPNVPLCPCLQSALLKLAAATFAASEVRLWLGPGARLLQRVWSASRNSEPSSLRFALNFNVALAELGWGGWKPVALPLVFKETATCILDLEPRGVLAFFSTLRRLGKLDISELDPAWRDMLEKFALHRLEQWTLNYESDSILELDNITMLSSFFSSDLSPILIKIIDRMFSQPPESPLIQYRASISNSALALGICMHTLANRDPIEWATSVDVVKWVKASARHWPWSHDVLGGLYHLSQSSPNISQIAFEEVYDALQGSLSSHSRQLRLCSLRLLGSKLISSPIGVSDVIRRCLQGEEVPLDVQGVRERVLRIGRVGQIHRDGDATGADVSIRWLISQLKVSLRPIWSPASGALSALAESFGDMVWRLLFGELKTDTEKWGDNFYPSWLVSEDDDIASASNDWEEERSWRDPSAHKLRDVVSRLENLGHRTLEFRKSHSFKENLNRDSFELQLLATLEQCVSLAEKHNRELVSYFLVLVDHDSLSTLSKHKLVAWLDLFSKFHNPKALYATDTLRTLYLSFLSHHDRTIQKATLSCFLTYKSPHLTPYEEKFNLLLDETYWRDELTSLDLSSIHIEHRNSIIDVLIRLLFGMISGKKGRTRGSDRRAAILSTLGGCTEEELGLLVDLMLLPLKSDSKARQGTPFALMYVDPGVSVSQKIGFLTLLGDVVKDMGPKLLRYWPSLIGKTIDLVADSQQRLEGLSNPDQTIDVDAKGEDDEIEEVQESASSSRTFRNIRQLGFKRLTDFFLASAEFDFTAYLPICFSSIISPRITSIDNKRIQVPSALLELVHSWCLREDYSSYTVVYDKRLLPKIYNCLIFPDVKLSIVNRIFDIVENLLATSSINEVVRDTVIKPYTSVLLSNLCLLFQNLKGAPLMATPNAQRQISIVSQIAEFTDDPNQASMILTLFAPLLRKPAKFVSERVKVDILKTIIHLMYLIPQLSDQTSEVYKSVYKVFSQLFQSLRSRASRLSLVNAFQQLASFDVALQNVATLVDELNAYSNRQVDEPDFDRRLEAFTSLNENMFQTLLPSEWLPIVYNMLYFIHDPLELAIRNSAAFALRRFVDIVASNPSSDFEVTFLLVLYPGLKNGLRSRNEMVRAEILEILAYSVNKCLYIGSLQEMKGLLADGDEEASFFNNVLHVQVHRRSRALRRLSDYCDGNGLRSSTLSDIFVPLVGNFIASAASMDHHLVNEAVLTTGRIAKHLAWGPYHTLVRKHLKLAKLKDESARVQIRTLVAILNNFHFQMEDNVPQDEERCEDEVEEVEIREGRDVQVTHSQSTSTSTISKISDAVIHRLLPDLLSHLEKQDFETNDSTRIPISIGIVAIAKHLPTAKRDPQITKLLTALSQILRSKSQEMRDQVREALCCIAESLDQKYTTLMLKELRGALQRGPQLHVLAYVAHAIVVHITSGSRSERIGPLDDCVSDFAQVSAEVIFGDSGKDVQAEDFKTKMREVRLSASKGIDTFAIVARFINPSKITSLLIPLRSIMQETESVTFMNLVDEVLKRIAGGLNSNQYLAAHELLVLCNTLITRNAKFLQNAPEICKKNKTGDAIVQMKRHELLDTDHYANNSFRFVAFGLDLLQTALRRNRFDYRDTGVMARLDAIIVAIGNTLYSTSTPILLQGLRCVSLLAKCPLKSLDISLLVLVRQILDIIHQTGTADSEVVQTSLKTLATIFRDGPPVQVKEKDLVYLLELLSPDLEEPSRQASVFTMLRAIVKRKFVVPEIYDLMDRVSQVLVTSQSSHVQELCRGVFLQFLLDYPQGKGRLRNQMSFLAKNLSYVHESGRRSVMELLGAVISKFETGLVQEYTEMLFMALVMAMANDDSYQCREMAALLMKSLFSRLEEDRRIMILRHVHTWATQGQAELVHVSYQIYGLIIDVLKTDAKEHLSRILGDLNTTLACCAQKVHSAEVEYEGNAMDVDLDWQISYHVISVFEKVFLVFPDFLMQEGAIDWNHLTGHLLYPNSRVRAAACSLLGLLFAVATVPSQSEINRFAADHPLSLQGMKNIAWKLCLQLKSEQLEEGLGLQIVKNLFFLGKCFCAIPLVEAMEMEVQKREERTNVDEAQKDEGNLLPWLFSKLSYQIRSAHIVRRIRAASCTTWFQQPLSILRWFAAMVSYMEVEILGKFLVHILTPMYWLIEDDTICDSQMEDLKSTATELLDMVQAKVGTTKFSIIYSQIRQSVLGVRRERKQKKAVRAAVDPKGTAKRRMQRNLGKKDSRKRKERGFAERRGKLKRRRSE